jgi:hypothetical protein
MAHSITPGGHSVHPPIVAMRGEGVRKKVANPETVKRIGAAIESALDYADLTRQEAAFRMGYADETSLARWISGAEPPNLAKLIDLGPRFEQGLLIAIGRGCGLGVRVKTTIELEATA